MGNGNFGHAVGMDRLGTLLTPHGERERALGRYAQRAEEHS